MFRDVTIIVVGALGFLQQVFIADEANLLVVTASVQLLLTPVGIAVWAQRKQLGQPTIGPSSEEPPQSSVSPVQPVSPR